VIDIKSIKRGNCIVWKNEPCFVKDIAFTGNKINIVLECLFSGKSFSESFSLNSNLEEADITRKCGTILAKGKNQLKIMDLVNFETFNASVDKELLAQTEVNDHVTYIKFKDNSKVVEVRKQLL
jgi:translation elongation factor P/translation initiation factor 5A